MSYKYLIGERVKVRSDLKEWQSYQMGRKYFVKPKMAEFKDCIVTISGCEAGRYTIEEDGGVHGWTDELFEKTNWVTIFEDTLMGKKIEKLINIEVVGREAYITFLFEGDEVFEVFYGQTGNVAYVSAYAGKCIGDSLGDSFRELTENGKTIIRGQLQGEMGLEIDFVVKD